MKTNHYTLGLLPTLALLIVTLNSAVAKDTTLLLPLYTPLDNIDSVQGTLSSAGSTTVSPILEVWLKEFKKLYPAIDFEMSAEGSGSAPEALMNGTAMLGAMSRSIKDKEIVTFRKLKYYEPTEIRVSLDALGIIVHPLNPINNISQLQLDAIYSRTRNCGHATDITYWNALGWSTPKELEVRIISPHSGGSGFFSKKTMCGGVYKMSKHPLIEKGTAMVETVSKNRFSLGIASMSKINSSVKTLKISESKQHPSYFPSPLNITNSHYPLTRYLYIYIDKRPETELPIHLREFIKFMFSRQGQRIALANGGFPLSPTEIGGQLNKLLF